MQQFFVSVAVTAYPLNVVASTGGAAGLGSINRANALNQGPIRDGSDTRGYILPQQSQQSQVPGWRQACLHPTSVCAKKSEYFTANQPGWVKRQAGGFSSSSAAGVLFETASGDVRPLSDTDSGILNASSASDVAFFAMVASNHGRVSQVRCCIVFEVCFER